MLQEFHVLRLVFLSGSPWVVLLGFVQRADRVCFAGCRSKVATGTLRVDFRYVCTERPATNAVGGVLRSGSALQHSRCGLHVFLVY